MLAKIPAKDDVVRIDVLLHPHDDPDCQGEFEWRYMQDRYLLSLDLVEKELEPILGDRLENALLLLMNFPRIYVIRSTRELHVATQS